jgi:hypothetical protein
MIQYSPLAHLYKSLMKLLTWVPAGGGVHCLIDQSNTPSIGNAVQSLQGITRPIRIDVLLLPAAG